MKKLLALALVVLGLAACQTEPEGLDVQMGGEQEVMLTVSLPEATRANSAEGAYGNVDWDTYTLRYILEVYRVVNATTNELTTTCQRFVETSDDLTMVFPVRLAPDYSYQVVAWADIVRKDGAVLENGEKADRCYKTTDGLDAVEIIESMWNPMDETRDAYTAVRKITEFSSSSNLDMTLTRPFAKLRVVATDIDDIRKVGLKPTTATVEYSQDMYFKYNAVAETYAHTDSKSHDISYPATPVYNDATGEYTLFADYIFVPADGTAKFSLNVYADADQLMLIKDNNFNTEICVERNKLTTIKGDVLTIGGDVKVTVDNELGVKDVINIVDTANSLIDAIEDAEPGKETNIELGGDIDLDDLFSTGTLSTRAAATLPIVILEGKVVTLDLNGYKITTPFVEGSTTNHTYAFKNYGTLTIKDSSKGKTGEIIARGNFNYGSMTLESGKINACDGNGGYGVLNYEGAFIMNGGSIVTSYEDGDIPGEGIDASPVRVEKGATATINGGVINNVSNFTVAIDNDGTTIINDGTFTTIHTTIANSASMTINGGSFTCNGLDGISAHALWANAGTTTINGGTFDGKDNYNGFNVDADEGAIVNINGGKFLPVHSGSLYGKGTINVMGGEFFDDPSERLVAGYVVTEQENGYYVVENNGYYTDANGIYYITDVKGLQWLAEQTNGGNAFQGKTIKLVNDIDLNNVEWTPIGTKTNQFKGNLDGQSYTIKNLYIESEDNYQGLFGYATSGTISNLIIENANVKGKSYVAAVTGCGFLTSHSNITVTGDVKIEGSGQDIAVITGYTYANTTTININVNEGSYVKGDSFFGSVVGYPGEGNTKFENIKSNIDVIGKRYMIGGITGIAMYGNKFIDCHYSGNVYLMEGDATSNNRWMRIGGIAGSWMDGNESYVVTLENCSFTGELFSQKTDGTTATKFDFDGYVGRSYNATNVGKLIINGKTYTKVASIGDTSYLSLEEAIAAAQNDDTIVLCNNVTLTETATIAEGKTVVLDLNGKTLSAVDMNTIKNNGGNLTIKNGTVTRTGDVVGYSVNNASGEIAVENATIERGLYTSGSKMTATNANISHDQSTRHAIYAWNCEVTINSGTFHNDNAGNATLMASGSSIVTINGGTFSIADGRSTIGWTSSMIDQNSTAQVIVKGGLFNGGFRINSADTTLTIEGGEFNTNNGSAFTDSNGTKVVKGGKFTDAGAQNWAKKYIAEGYEMNANGEVVVK